MRSRRPISINNSLAHGICNYSCRLCAVNKPGYCGPKEYQPREVTERLIARVEEAAAAGIRVRYIANAGDGEPTLHPEFGERMDMFGRMLREWAASVPAPEVSVVSNGLRLLEPGVLEAVARNRLTLIVSFPTCKAEAYGETMVGKAERGEALLSKVVPGVERAMEMAAKGEIARLYFHVSPPEREFVRRDFPETVEFLASRAAAAGMREVELTMFPATSNRSGLLRSRFAGIDTYRDLFRKWNGRRVCGVTVRMKLVLKRFFESFGELAELVRAFRFPCLWNANLFIAAGGESICCNDQAVRNPLGNVLTNSIAELMAAKESYLPGKVCAGCDQRPERMTGSPAACTFALAARSRLALARLSAGGKNEDKKEVAHVEEERPVVVEAAAGYGFAGRAGTLRGSGDGALSPGRADGTRRARELSGRDRIVRSRLTEVLRALEEKTETADTEYRFGPAGDYRIRVASSVEDRIKAWGLVYRIYVQKEYAGRNAQGLWYGLHDALPGTTTLLVERTVEGGGWKVEGQGLDRPDRPLPASTFHPQPSTAAVPVATLTLVFDSPLGLPADGVYGAELAAMRAAGRRPCEIVSLVSAEGDLRRGMEIMKHLFKLSYLAARRLTDATDFLITVNPRHVSFYKRILLMNELGPERPYGKVGGAPAVLLGLDLIEAERLYRERYGDDPAGLCRFFVNAATEPQIIEFLSAGRRPLDEAALRRFFVEERPLLPEADRVGRAHVEELYLAYDLAATRN